MKKSVFTLLALLACTIYPVRAYEYFTIYFSDGTKSEAFYATDVDSLCYSKLSLDSIAYDDWQVQEIYACDSVYRYPLAQIDSLSFKYVDESVVKQDIEKISDAIMPLYLQSSSISEIVNLLPTISNTDGVEDAWTDSQSLFVKIRDWGTLTFLYPPRRSSSPNDIFMARQTSQPLKRSIQDNNNDAKSICIVNQMSNARQFDYDTELKDSLEKHCKLWGLNTKRVNVPTRDFYKNDMFEYDIVFLDTHGYYAKGLHWLLTGEMVMHSIIEYETSKDVNYIIEELYSWPLLWKERVFSLKYGSPLDISLAWVKDSLNNGKWRADCYVAVSQNFIKSSGRKFNANGRTIMFNAACQSVKNDPGMAAVFTKDKGAACYLGYDDTNTKGGQAGTHYIEYLLSGKSAESVYNQMLKDDYMCKLCKEDTIIDNQRIQPTLRSYTYGVKADTLRITHPLTRDVEETKFDDGSIGYIFSGENKTNNNSFYESKNGYALYVSESPEFSSREQLGDFQYDVSQNSKIIWSCPPVKLKPNTVYYYVAGFSDGYSNCYGEVKSFTTSEKVETGKEAYYVFNDDEKVIYYFDSHWEHRPYSYIHFLNNKDIIVDAWFKQVEFDSSFMNFFINSIEFGGSKLQKITGLEYLNFNDAGSISFHCSSITKLDLSSSNFSSGKLFGLSFSSCESLESINLNGVNTINIVSWDEMFRGCCSLTSLDLNNFDTSKATSMRGMFAGCSSLTKIELGSFDTDIVEDMGGMFTGCSSLENIDLTNFDTSNVVTMSNMFSGCSSLTDINLHGFSTIKVKYLSSMFADCSSLTSLDLSSFNTQQVTGYKSLFSGCSKLITLDLSSFTIKGGGNDFKLTGMFDYCESLKTIYANDWPFNYSVSFVYCKNLTGGQGSKIGYNIYDYDANGNPVYYYCDSNGNAAHIDGGKDNPGLFTAK